MKYIILFISFILILKTQTIAQNLYFPPISGNAWDSILPSDIGYCQPRIDSLLNYLQAKNTDSFIILKDGKRVIEKYFGSYTATSTHYWASAGKSLSGFIAGVAQQKGFINVNNLVSQYLGTGWTTAPLAKENLITVKDLLKMTSGLEDAPPLPCTNDDTAKSCLIYKTNAATRWAYHTGAYKKVQDVVSTSAGLSYNLITNNWIESKTGMSGVWYQQVYYSIARDMARFGLLNLNKGIWQNDTIMKDSLYFKAMVNSSQPLNKAYGYLWWLNGKSDFMVPQSQLVLTGSLMPNAPNDMFCALGRDDQKIYIVPSQNLVVIRQGSSAGGFSLASSAFDNVLWDYINKLSCTTSIATLRDNSSFTVFPNPTENFIKISTANAFRKVLVTDVYGQTVISQTIEKNTSTVNVDLTELSKGIYFVNLENDTMVSEFKKIVKQ